MLRGTLSSLAVIAVLAACDSSEGTATNVTDAGSEAASVVDAAPPITTGCRTALIETFDGGYAVKWTEKTTPGGEVEIVKDELVASKTADATEGHARVEYTPGAGLPKTARLRFEVLLAAIAGGSADVGCKISGAGIGLRASEGALTVNGLPLAGFAMNEWYAVEFELRDITPSGAHAVAKVGGATVDERDVTFAAAMSAIDVVCGLPAIDPNVSATVRVDDVKVERCD